EDHAARFAIRFATSSGRHSSAWHFANQSVRRKSEPARSSRNGTQINFAGVGDDEWKRDRGCEKTRDQPANIASQNQRIERGQVGERNYNQNRTLRKCPVAKNLFKARSTPWKQAGSSFGSSAARSRSP